MTVGSLFSGIGGLDLGLERAGMTVRWQVERDPWCQKVLRKHWPDVPRYEDVTTLTGDELAPVDLICGGFPCQPVSVAGQQKGTDDARWLWPEFRRLVGHLRPKYVCVENVPGLFTAGRGHAFGEVIGDLADLGYDAEWTVLSAADVGAPHLRKRVWIIGIMADAELHDGGPGAEEIGRQAGARSRRPHRSQSNRPDVADANGAGCEERRGAESVESEQRSVERAGDVAHAEVSPEWAGLRTRRSGGERRRRSRDSSGTLADTNSGRCHGIREPQQRTLEGTRGHQSDGCDADRGFFDAEIGGDWEPEPQLGRVATGIPRRVDRLRGLGNAVVPQCAEWIGRRILAVYEESRSGLGRV